MEMDSFHLNPDYFPESTRGWLDVPTILTHGMLPLGIKHGYRFGFLRTTFANVGCLGPVNRAQKAAVQHKLKKQGVGGVHFYQVEPAPFWEVLQKAYGVGPAQLKAESNQPLHPSLSPYSDSV